MTSLEVAQAIAVIAAASATNTSRLWLRNACVRSRPSFAQSFMYKGTIARFIGIISESCRYAAIL